MDYDSTDRDMSSWVVTCVQNGTRFYLTRDKYASDDFGRAYRHRYIQIAEAVAKQERQDDEAWQGRFDWRVMSVPEASAGFKPMREFPSDYMPPKEKS